MVRLVVVLVLAVLVVLAALTAFGNTGWWVAGVALAVVAATVIVGRPKTIAATVVVGVVVCVASFATDFPWVTARSLMANRSIQLRQLCLAMEHYQEHSGSFPPAFIADDDGRPMHSWRVLVLAFIEQDHLARNYDLSKSWDSPNNLRLVSKMPDFFRTRGDESPPTTGVTNIVAVVGPETAWPGARARTRDEFGERKVLLFVETFASDIPWTEPRDLSVDELVAELAPKLTVFRWWLKLPPTGWRSARHPIGRAVVLSDGSAHFVRGDLSPEAVRALARMEGVEGVEGDVRDLLQGRDLVPPMVANLPVSEGTIRFTGFLVLLAAAIALQAAVGQTLSPAD